MTDDMPPLVRGADESDEGSDDDESWLEVDDDNNENATTTRCLFCADNFKSVELAIVHLSAHHIDLGALKKRFDMDQYSFIKMVNFIRTHASSPEEFRLPTAAFWDDDKYLKPLEFEEWLMFDFEDFSSSETDNAAASAAADATAESQIIIELRQQLTAKNQLLKQAADDLDELKAKFRQIFDDEDNKLVANKSATTLPAVGPCVASVPLQQDDGYFQTYSHYGIHHDMLSDVVRTTSYRDAIVRNSNLFADKTVMDLGCGTSILSMFAAQAGAKKVISVDQSDIIYQAMDIVRKNNIKNIHFVKGRLEDTEIPVAKVDIIISEWMGYFLLFEGMLDSVIYARDNYLAAGGTLLPNRCNISLTGYGDLRRHQELIQFWDNVYGFDMRNLKADVLSEASVELCKAEHLLTSAQVIADFDLMSVDVNCSNFEFNFELLVERDGELTALVGYFDTFFELDEPVRFSTGPAATATHWKQVAFYVRQPIAVRQNERVCGKFVCRRDRKDVRSLCVTIEMFGQTMKYHLN